MAKIAFTPQLALHIDCPAQTEVTGTLREALEDIFSKVPKSRGYLLDDQGAVRKHVAIFVNGQLLRQPQQLDIPLTDACDVYVMQALSGG